MKPTIVVSGFPRTGTSLMCRVLAGATGTPIFGDAVSGEVSATELENIDWRKTRGHVVKALDPNVMRVERIPLEIDARCVWMERDPKIRAASQARFMEATVGLRMNRGKRRQMEAAYRRDRRRALAWFRHQLVEVRFGDLVTYPERVLGRVCYDLGLELTDGYREALASVEVRGGEHLRPTLIELEQGLLA